MAQKRNLPEIENFRQLPPHIFVIPNAAGFIPNIFVQPVKRLANDFRLMQQKICNVVAIRFGQQKRALSTARGARRTTSEMDACGINQYPFFIIVQ